jgi:hypothetical protein
MTAMKKLSAFIGALVMASGASALAQSIEPITVTVDNFSRAETDVTMAAYVKLGALGKMLHAPAPVSVDEQKVVRLNRDTLYSFGVFDLDAGPVTLTLPDSGKRYMMAQVIDQDHFTHDIVYAPGSKTYAKEMIGTRYMIVLMRTLADPQSEDDLTQARELQHAVKTSQSASGEFQIPDWDAASQSKVRDALRALGATLKGTERMFGSKDEVDPVRHLIGAAVGWGANPSSVAIYLFGAPKNNDGTEAYRMTVKDVPVDGFWSISVYNAQGYFEKNALNAYSINNITAKPDSDGAVTVQFGGCDGATSNCIPIMKGWNYTVRLYRPRAEIVDGRWTFPEPEPVQ